MCSLAGPPAARWCALGAAESEPRGPFEQGARKVIAYITHPVLSGKAVERISTSELDELVVTDTIPLSDQARACSKIRQLSCAALLGETILRISNAESVSSLFVD
jgi:ribose-phosphate pyrophosphokinase